jgi:hypothetical protein
VILSITVVVASTYLYKNLNKSPFLNLLNVVIVDVLLLGADLAFVTDTVVIGSSTYPEPSSNAIMN